VGRIILLSVSLLLVLRGTSVALPESVNIYGLYDTPSSGALAATTNSDIRDASPMFRIAPNGGFGPPTASFQIQNDHFSVVQPHPALQFKDRWLFDYASGSHHPHHQQHHKRPWVRSVEDSN
jgi:hypothetical protein